ncbi:hypothetical protein DY240_19040 [Jiangella rhizosphaerae]|uniref:Uncharacterized protein n=1 Tax=Jiangella rhizosphaerae TaxID=2293569 RepID=A0A418KMM8_9ACTN|nr:hypothetical protein DY240_19040 [Jiangella rhizosphaerae]
MVPSGLLRGGVPSDGSSTWYGVRSAWTGVNRSTRVPSGRRSTTRLSTVLKAPPGASEQANRMSRAAHRGAPSLEREGRGTVAPGVDMTAATKLRHT